MNVSEEFKKFCLDCKHRGVDAAKIENLNADGSSTFWIETKHICTFFCKSPDWIWEDSDASNPLPPDDGSILYQRLKQYYIREESCPYYLEYIISKEDK